MPEVWYRFEDMLVSSGVDEFDNPLGPPRLHVYIKEFDLIRTTPKGVWICVYGRNRFVLTAARKRFACPSIEEARQSFIARKRRQISILGKQLNRANKAIEVAKSLSQIRYGWTVNA